MNFNFIELLIKKFIAYEDDVCPFGNKEAFSMMEVVKATERRTKRLEKYIFVVIAGLAFYLPIINHNTDIINNYVKPEMQHESVVSQKEFVECTRRREELEHFRELHPDYPEGEPCEMIARLK